MAFAISFYSHTWYLVVYFFDTTLLNVVTGIEKVFVAGNLAEYL